MDYQQNKDGSSCAEATALYMIQYSATRSARRVRYNTRRKSVHEVKRSARLRRLEHSHDSEGVAHGDLGGTASGAQSH